MHALFLIYSAFLRLQLNYFMQDNYLPSVNDTTVGVAATVCANYTALTGANFSCVAWDYLFQCLNIPSDWKYYKGGVYMPYAWVEESVAMDEDTANGFKDINSLKIFKQDLETWSFVVAGKTITTMLYICICITYH